MSFISGFPSDPALRPLPFSRILRTGMPESGQLPLFDGDEALRFVIRNHQASRLHKDFRFCLFDVLFSLLLPFDLSLDPRRPMLAKEMNDHDPRYMESERRIPDGYTGAGPTGPWDLALLYPLFFRRGRLHQDVLVQLQKGRFDFWLEGRQLRGTFRLERRGRHWEFRKLEDEFAVPGFVDWDHRLMSGRFLRDIENDYRRRLGLPLL